MTSLDIIDHSPHHPKPSAALPTASNLVLIDNYDSFTYNVYQYLVLEGATVTVFRNDQISLEELIAKKPTQLVVSPGPGHPRTDSGVSRDAIRHFAGKIPIFGVCMGQQCILDVYGGDVSQTGEILHGKTSPLVHDSKGVYRGMSQDLPEDGSKGVIMGVRHKEFTIEGVQFHPESILSADGRTMFHNFLLTQGGTWKGDQELRKTEIKRGSPSKGVFALDINAPTQAKKYALAGASVISVLTEPEWFKGSIEDLRVARQALEGMPNRPAILRKEFVFEEYQILEARLAGADTILLIVKMLDSELLEKLYKYSLSLGMEPLVEVQNAEEMTTAIKLGAKVVGVNNRNLETFEVDLRTTRSLRSMVPQDVIICALSGINTHADVQDCKNDGVNAILVGEAIMRAPDTSKFIQELCSGTTILSPKVESQPLIVKICGTRSAEAATEAIKAGADLIGMILVPGTKRCVSHETALAISKAVQDSRSPGRFAQPKLASDVAQDFFAAAKRNLTGKGASLVGVFMNQPLEEVLEKQILYNLDIVQLHGREPVEWAHLVPVPVIRKFQPGEPGLGLRGYHTIPLLDSGSGSGQQLDHAAVRKDLEKDESLEVLFAGGLNPDNVAKSVSVIGPLSARIAGVDVSSGVEEGGQQSIDKIRAFIKAAKSIR
ncbi:putative anthranilate synthase multifunctional protein [Diaporthe ampelina]|uniref:Putative anthranilate synthase multifunctional protein n=1 Tax=Diaporthe ampelina TaxID=1214573 RepID=A0A0G2HVX7_9PEZI|nr:putative anthranilate synthase multifunctional protein [Diaporthe ampelina]